VFCSKKRANTLLYSQKTLSTSQIYTIVKEYTSVFRSSNAQSFAACCRNTKVNFLNAKDNKGKQVTRELSVLEESYYGKPN
jgi:4-hydroxy-3-methylbut-2-enyl diphosphate reductase IspH